MKMLVRIRRLKLSSVATVIATTFLIMPTRILAWDTAVDVLLVIKAIPIYPMAAKVTFLLLSLYVRSI